MRSHPVWVRGLKFQEIVDLIRVKLVVPRVGAWIETKPNLFAESRIPSHPVWVRGLKYVSKEEGDGFGCRTPCGCVD